MRERSKRRKLVSAAMILCILASMLSGCGKSDRESYASAEEAKQAMNQCRTFVVEGDLEDVNQEGDILADGKRAGRLKETGILNTKWTVSVDGKTWFWIKFVTDEPINNIDGVIAGTTYGYYDENNRCLGYAQERLFENENLEREYYLVFMDADGNPKDYLAEEHGKELYNYDGSQIGSGKADLKCYFLKECYTEIDTDPGVSVDAVDKMAMYLQLFSKFNETAGD